MCAPISCYNIVPTFQAHSPTTSSSTLHSSLSPISPSSPFHLSTLPLTMLCHSCPFNQTSPLCAPQSPATISCPLSKLILPQLHPQPCTLHSHPSLQAHLSTFPHCPSQCFATRVLLIKPHPYVRPNLLLQYRAHFPSSFSHNFILNLALFTLTHLSKLTFPPFHTAPHNALPLVSF